MIDNFGDGPGNGDAGLAELGVGGNRLTLSCWSATLPFPWSTILMESVESSNVVLISGGARY